MTPKNLPPVLRTDGADKIDKIAELRLHLALEKRLIRHVPRDHQTAANTFRQFNRFQNPRVWNDRSKKEEVPLRDLMQVVRPHRYPVMNRRYVFQGRRSVSIRSSSIAWA